MSYRNSELLQLETEINCDFSGLKHLRIAHLDIENTTFAKVINSLGQLEDLDLIKVRAQDRDSNNVFHQELDQELDQEFDQELGLADHQEEALHPIQLTLPNLKSIEFDNLKGRCFV